MKPAVVAAIALVASTAVTSAAGELNAGEASRLGSAARVIQEFRAAIPQEYWEKARCVIVIPELKKAAFIIGGEYGKGAMSCRTADGWSAPMFIQLAKGSWGFQMGAEEIDVVLLVMNEEGVQKLLDNKVTLGADASIAAGPVGRQGQVDTDMALTAEIVAYSRAKGLYAGIDLSGGTLRPDSDANTEVYGTGATARTILATREISAPTEAHAFLTALRTHSAAVPTATTGAATSAEPSATAPTTPRSTAPAAVDDLRARVVEMQQALDRMLADTSAGGAARGSVSVDRAQLLQIRNQLDALLAALNRR